jgi:hypothetical protein
VPNHTQILSWAIALQKGMLGPIVHFTPVASPAIAAPAAPAIAGPTVAPTDAGSAAPLTADPNVPDMIDFDSLPEEGSETGLEGAVEDATLEEAPKKWKGKGKEKVEKVEKVEEEEATEGDGGPVAGEDEDEDDASTSKATTETEEMEEKDGLAADPFARVWKQASNS